MLKRYFKNLHVKIAVSLVLFVSGSWEALHEFKSAEGFSIGAHHGIMIYALFQMLGALAELVESAEEITEHHQAEE